MTVAPHRPQQLPPLARQRERSMLVAGLLDTAILFAIITASIWASSLMMAAEAVRGFLLILLEMLLLLVLRRIHRGRTTAYDYGAGKIEQFANLGIGTAMGIGGVWVAVNAAYCWWHPSEQDALGLTFAALVGAVNVVENGVAFWALWRAGRDGASIIILGQVRTRLAKLVSSLIVLAALIVNAIFSDGPIGNAADVLGSAFVALVMFNLAVSMWHAALPSLLDRSLAETYQGRINHALVTHFEDYDALVAVRSRLSGNTPVIEVVLGFTGERRMSDVQRVVDDITRTVQKLIPDSHVTVTPVAHG